MRLKNNYLNLIETVAAKPDAAHAKVSSQPSTATTAKPATSAKSGPPKSQRVSDDIQVHYDF